MLNPANVAPSVGGKRNTMFSPFSRQHQHSARHHTAVHRHEPESVHAADAHGHRRREREEDQREHEDGRSQGLCLLGSQI